MHRVLGAVSDQKMDKERVTINPDLKREREQCSFDPLNVTYALDGGIKQTYRRRYIGQSIKLIISNAIPKPGIKNPLCVTERIALSSEHVASTCI